jgi:micrococcal nuclease
VNKKLLTIILGVLALLSIIGFIKGIQSLESETYKTPAPINTEKADVSLDATSTPDTKKLADPVIPKTVEVIPPKNTSTPAQKPAEQKEEYYLITNVVDGDTFDVNINGTTEGIRLIGMDTPELKDPRKPVQCFAAEASAKAKELLLNKKVKLVADPTQDNRDKYDRLLRYTYREDGLFFNKWMVENGYAFEYTYDIPYQFQQEFKAAELSARNGQLGLWSPDTCNGSTELKTIATNTDSSAALPPGEHKWYTSSYYSSKYYYCDTDDQWEGLSKTYLKEFNSAGELLAAYPTRTLHEPCR